MRGRAGAGSGARSVSTRRTASLFISAVIVLILSTLACSGAMEVSDEDMAKADYHFRLARNYYNDHNIAMTRKEIHEALQYNPRHAEALHLRGFMLMGLKEYDRAAASLRSALQVKPDLYEARNNLGAVLIAQGRYAEAIQVLTPLLEEPLYPTPWFAQGNVGFSYMKLGDIDNARTHLETAVFLNPRFCLGQKLLGEVYEKQRRFDRARDCYLKAVKFCPKYAEAYYRLGVLQQRAHESAAAAASFARCAELGEGTVVGKRCALRR